MSGSPYKPTTLHRREKLLVTNVTEKEKFSLGDLTLAPVLHPGDTIDLLRFETWDRIRNSESLNELVETNKITIQKNLDSLPSMWITDTIAPHGFYPVTHADFRVSEDGTLTSIGRTRLNFTGATVTNTLADDGQLEVTIGIIGGTLEYASRFNDNAGLTDARVSNVSTSNRRVSSPTSEGLPFKIGDWTSDSIQNVTNSNSIAYSSVEFSVESTSSTLTLEVLDSDGISELASLAVTVDSDKSASDGSLSVSITDFQEEHNRHKASFSGSINLATLIPEGGRFSVRITHSDSGNDYVKTQNDLFFDPNPIEPTVTGVTFSDTTPIIVRHLSGVRYFGPSSQFTVSVDDIDNINNRSYPDVQLSVNGSEFFLSQIDVGRSSLTDWNDAYDLIDVSYSKSDWTISSNSYFIGQRRVHAYWHDWSSGSPVFSPSRNVAINTFSDNSTRVYEDFRSETYRLTSAYAAWDSQLHLQNIDSGNGLQVSGDIGGSNGSRLIYPQHDYRTYDPRSEEQPDYTSLEGSRIYIRRFFHVGTSHSNGILRFGDHNIIESDISSDDISLEISLNGTDWYDCTLLYLGGTLSDGSPCRINSDTNNLTLNGQLEFTLGTGSFTSDTSGGGWGIFVRIGFSGSANSKTKYIGSLEITNW